MSKANNLKFLQELGYNVPPFIIIKDKNNINVSQLLKNNYYVVRSSANLEDSSSLSFAGIFDTFLNIPFDTITEHVNKVFNTCENKKLDAYLNKFQINRELLILEVIVQEIINCDKAGVAFSCNPVNKEKEIYIECVWGLGELCVSGKSLSDTVVVSEGKIVKYSVGFQYEMLRCRKDIDTILQKVELINQSKRKLTQTEITCLIETIQSLSEKIEYEFEIEWGFYEGRLYLFQLRPITAID